MQKCLAQWQPHIQGLLISLLMLFLGLEGVPPPPALLTEPPNLSSAHLSGDFSAPLAYFQSGGEDMVLKLWWITPPLLWPLATPIYACGQSCNANLENIPVKMTFSWLSFQAHWSEHPISPADETWRRSGEASEEGIQFDADPTDVCFVFQTQWLHSLPTENGIHLHSTWWVPALCPACAGHWDHRDWKDPVLVLRELSSIWSTFRLLQVHDGANLPLIHNYILCIGFILKNPLESHATCVDYLL